VLTNSAVKRLVVTATSVIHGFAIVTSATTLENGMEFIVENGAAAGSGVTVSLVQFSSSVASNLFKMLLPTNFGTDAVGVILNPGESMVFRYTDNPGVGGSLRVRAVGSKSLTSIIAAGAVLGNPITASSSAPAAALTRVQLGANIAFDTFLQITNAPATINDQAVTAGVRLIRVAVSSAGDLNLTGFAFSAGNTGEFFFLFKQGATGRVVLKHGTGSVAANQIVTPGGVDFAMSRAESCVLVQYIGGRFQIVWLPPEDASLTNAMLASMGPRTVKGKQTDAVTGVPVDLTGAELCENIRRDTIQTLSGVSGFLDVLLNDDTTVLLVRTTADATLRTMSAGTGGGREIMIEHDRLSGTGNLTVAHNTAGTYFPFFLPLTTSIVLGQTECLSVRDRSTFWRSNGPGIIGNARLTDMVAATLKGRARGAGTGPPADLAGNLVGEIIRKFNVVADGASTGSVTAYALITETTTQVRFTGSGALTIHGIATVAANFGQEIEWHVEAGASVVVTFKYESVSATGDKLRTPDGIDFVLRANQSIRSTYYDNRHRFVGSGPQPGTLTPLMLAPVAIALGVPFVMPIVLTAGTPGTPDDVTVYNANAPFAFEVMRIDGRVTAAIAASTLEGRSAAAGGGSSLTDTLSGAAVGPAAITAPLGSIATVAAGGSLFIRRSDRGVGGKAYIHAIRT
jgi:hypothetical protein